MTVPSILRTVAAVAFVLAYGSIAEAVCVTDGQGPCYRFWKVDAVFVAKVVEKEALKSADVFPENYRLHVVVIEAFRGVTFAQRLTLYAPDGVCGGVGARQDEELFIYASRKKRQELWALGCGESKPIEDAAADLAYARSVTEQGPAAVVYGDVVQREERYGDDRDLQPMSGVRVRVTAATFIGETFTDEEGNYAITLPGSGSYSIDVTPPEGFAEWFPGPVRFEIGDRRSCYREGFQLQSNGRIRGRIVDNTGEPVRNLMLRAGESPRFSKTDDGGRFDIGPLSEGFHNITALLGGETDVRFEKAVHVQSGRVTELDSITFPMPANLATIAIDVLTDGADDVSVLLATHSGEEMSGLLPAGREPIRFLVERGREFLVVAASQTHVAENKIRAADPETVVTLVPRRRPSP